MGQLADDRLHASIICDGFHLMPEMVQVIVRIKGLSRTILVTDAVHVAGLGAGEYTLVGVPIELQASGRVARIGSDSMAGSSLGMNRAVTIFEKFAGLSLAEAVAAATSNPASLLGRPTLCADLSAGQPANLVSFRTGPRELQIESVWLQGEKCFHGPSFES